MTQITVRGRLTVRQQQAGEIPTIEIGPFELSGIIAQMAKLPVNTDGHAFNANYDCGECVLTLEITEPGE